MNDSLAERGKERLRLGELAHRAREVVAAAVKASSRTGRVREEAGRERARSVAQAKAEAVRRARRGAGKEGRNEGGGAAAFASSERLRQWRQEFFRHARRFGWASELLRSEEWQKAGRALAEERLRDSAIHLAQAGLRVGSQGLGTVVGGMLGAGTGPGAAVAAWAGGTFLGALGARAASALDAQLSHASRRMGAGRNGKGR